MTRIKNGAVIPTKALQFVEQTLLTDPENRTVEVVSNAGTAGKVYITLMGGEGAETPTRKELLAFEEAIENIAEIASNLKEDYTTGNLDAEAEVIAAINATNAKVNAALDAINALTVALTTAGFMAAAE